MFRRPIVLLALAVAVLIAWAAPARAHVTVDPEEAPKGGYTKLTFRVPNERDNASTTKLEVKLPEDNPIENVSVKPVPGWTATVAGSVVTWEGGQIKPGEFEEFAISVGPLPDDVDQLVFPAVQTYGNGEVVRWSELEQPGGEEPKNPAPVLKLVDAPEGTDHHGDTTESSVSTDEHAAGESTSHDDDEDSGKGIAIVALIVGALGLVAGTTGLAIGRRA